MQYKVAGKLKSTIVLYEENKNIFDELKNKKVKYLNIELESADYINLYGVNVSIHLSEMFDACIDDWHGSVEIVANVTLPIEARSDKQAMEIAEVFYSSDFYLEKIQLFMENGIMIELEADGTYITYNDTKELLHMDGVI